MTLLASFLSAFAVSPEPEPASPKSAAVATTKKEVHHVLATPQMPALSYSFGVDHNPTISNFFQHYIGTEHEYDIRKVIEWINEGMPSNSYGNRMRGNLKRIIDAEDKEDKMEVAKRKMIYTIILQHANNSSPIDDNWKTQEVIHEPTGIISVEIVKGTHESEAFVSHVTDRKYPLLTGEMLYVVHIENMPYESYEGEDNSRINHAHQWLRKTLTELQQKHDIRYMIVCSPFASNLFGQRNVYPLRQEFQENTRMYRTLLASSDLLVQEEQELKVKMASTEDETQRAAYENQMKRYQHYKVLLEKKDVIRFGMKKVDEFLRD